MSYLKRISNNLDAKEKTLLKNTFISRVFEAIVIASQSFILIAMIHYIYNGGSNVWHFAGFGGAIFVIFFIRRFLINYYMRELFVAGFNVGFKIRKGILSHMIRMPLGALSELNIGKISQLLSEDISWFEDLVSFVGPTSIANILTSAFLVASVFFIDWHIGLVVLIIFIAIITIFIILKKRGERGLKFRSIGLSDASLRTVEFIYGMPILRAFGGYEKANTSFKKSIENLRVGFIKAIKRNARISAMFFFAMDSAVAFSILCSAYLVSTGVAEPIKLIAAMIVMLAAFIPLKGAIGLSVIANLVKISDDNISEIEKYKAFEDVENPQSPNDNSISFENVTFAYNDLGNVVKGVSFNTKANSMTAIVGPSGGGKTTIINLIARFWDVQSGAVKIGGVDIKNIKLEDTLSKISMVMQDVKLFNQSIYDNIAVGRISASKQEIIEAAKAAQAHDFILALEDGYDTQVGEGGAKLSGGERQRISIARAILKDSPIILLDEATSAIDPENEIAIQNAIGELTKDKTLIVIAHRLSTIVDADQIVVMEEGEVNAIGKHDELLKKSHLYSKLWDCHTNVAGWKIEQQL